MPKRTVHTKVVAWWLAGGEEQCPHCGQFYAYEIEFRCPECDEASCPHCKRNHAGGRVTCVTCCEDGDDSSG